MDNVLDIVTTIASYTSLCSCRRYKPSRYAKLSDSDENQNNEVTELYEKLAFKCLLTIDAHAELLLKSSDFLLLPAKMVQFILRRDTLCISSEILAVNALNRWCVNVCSTRRKVATLKNKVR